VQEGQQLWTMWDLTMWDLTGAHSGPVLLFLFYMAAAHTRRDELGMALVNASEAGDVLHMCRLINQGADVDYVLKWMVDGV
jgi:hypothetical protein